MTTAIKNPKKAAKKPSKRKLMRRPAAAEPIAATTKQAALTLSPAASELLRWYCSITKHHADDALEGTVFGTLYRAREAYRENRGGEHGWTGDESFNWLMSDVLQAMHGKQPGVDSAGNSIGVELAPEQKDLTTSGQRQASNEESAKSHRVAVELSDDAYALVRVLCKHDGYDSPEDAVRSLLASNVKSLAEFISRDNHDEIETMFKP